jgi:hypothetical protein
MALLFADSFDHYETADLSRKYSSVGQSTSIAANGRCNTNALVVNVDPAFSGVIKGVNVGSATCICGFALKITSADDTEIFSVMNASTHEITFAWDLVGSLRYSINPSAAFPTWTTCTNADVIRVGQWYFVEFKVAMSSSTGSIVVRVNGSDVTLAGFSSGLDTGASSWNGIALGGADFGGIRYHDDLYVSDTAGDAPWNDFLGDIRVEYLQPVADGAEQDWTNVGGAAAWNSVDDGSAPDDDTTYITTATQGDTSTFEYEDAALPSGANVFGVQMSFLALKDEPGDRAIRAVVREGSSDFEHETNVYISDDSYDYRHVMMQLNPADDAAWAIDDVNDDEFGVIVEV